jgi:CXXC-20-CXXC protein
MSLSKEQKQRIVLKAKSKAHRQKKRLQWRYRFVLATFMVFALGFGYLLWQQNDFSSKTSNAATSESETVMSWSILNSDFGKALLIIGFFLGLRMFLKRRLQKKGKSLPVCVGCYEEWSHKEALKQSMKNREMTCPHCGQKQYRTKKSALKGGMLNLFIPFFVIIPQLFEHIFIGLLVYIACVAYLQTSLNPYYIDLQEKDPVNDPLW